MTGGGHDSLLQKLDPGRTPTGLPAGEGGAATCDWERAGVWPACVPPWPWNESATPTRMRPQGETEEEGLISPILSLFSDFSICV